MTSQQSAVLTSERPPRTRQELLDLMLHYFGEARVQKIADQLSLPRHGGFKAPEKILIILFPSRAGSNYFGQLLSSTGWFNEIGESFNPFQLEKIRERYELNDHHEAVQWMIDNRGTEQAFGFKAGFFVLTAAVETGFLSEVIDRAQIVLLRRRDRVAQAISLEKGKLSGQMHSRQPVARELTDEDYDGVGISRQVVNIANAEVQLAECVERLGKTAPVVYYEDICADPQAHVAQVCNLMDLRMPEVFEPNKVRLEVLRDEMSDRWAERFRNEYPGLA